MHATVATLMPLLTPIERVLQCVAARDSDSSVATTTRSLSSSDLARGTRPGGVQQPFQTLAG